MALAKILSVGIAPAVSGLRLRCQEDEPLDPCIAENVMNKQGFLTLASVIDDEPNNMMRLTGDATIACKHEGGVTKLAYDSATKHLELRLASRNGRQETHDYDNDLGSMQKTGLSNVCSKLFLDFNVLGDEKRQAALRAELQDLKSYRSFEYETVGKIWAEASKNASERLKAAHNFRGNEFESEMQDLTRQILSTYAKTFTSMGCNLEKKIESLTADLRIALTRPKKYEETLNKVAKEIAEAHKKAGDLVGAKNIQNVSDDLKWIRGANFRDGESNFARFCELTLAKNSAVQNSIREKLDTFAASCSAYWPRCGTNEVKVYGGFQENSLRIVMKYQDITTGSILPTGSNQQWRSLRAIAQELVEEDEDALAGAFDERLLYNCLKAKLKEEVKSVKWGGEDMIQCFPFRSQVITGDTIEAAKKQLRCFPETKGYVHEEETCHHVGNSPFSFKAADLEQYNQCAKDPASDDVPDDLQRTTVDVSDLQVNDCFNDCWNIKPMAVGTLYTYEDVKDYFKNIGKNAAQEEEFAEIREKFIVMYQSFSQAFGCTHMTFKQFSPCLRLWHNPSTNYSPCVEGTGEELSAFFKTAPGKQLAAQILMDPDWVLKGDKYEVTVYVAGPAGYFNEDGTLVEEGDSIRYGKTIEVPTTGRHFAYIKVGKDCMGMVTDRESFLKDRRPFEQDTIRDLLLPIIYKDGKLCQTLPKDAVVGRNTIHD